MIPPRRASTIESLSDLREIEALVTASLKRGAVIPLDKNPTTAELLELLRRMQRTDA